MECKKKELHETKASANSNTLKIFRMAFYYTYMCVLALLGLIVVMFTTIKALLKQLKPRKKDISKDIILITGGGSGLGRQIALELTKYKPKKIILWGRNIQNLSDTSKDIIGLGVDCVYMSCDVSIKSNIDIQSEIVNLEHGPVSILINNAGVVFGGRLLELKDEDIETMFKVNMMAQYWTLRAFLPSMQEKKHGHIVTVGSCLGLIGMNQTGGYTSTKFGLTAYAECLSEVINKETYPGVKTTVVYPFHIKNKMFQGCESRYPWMFPPIDEKFAAVESVKAILTNTTSLIIPRHIGIITALHTHLPMDVDFHFGEFLGLSTAMETFTGHGKKAKTN